MMERLSYWTAAVGHTAEGYSLEVTYRIAGSPHAWQYLSLRGLLSEELEDLLPSVAATLRPGQEPPSMPGQVQLPL